MNYEALQSDARQKSGAVNPVHCKIQLLLWNHGDIAD